MADKINCPDKAELERLLLGELPDSTADQLEQHLLGCKPCGSVVQTLSGQDTLMEALRGADKAPAAIEEDVIRALTERAKALRHRVEGEPGQEPAPDAAPPALVDAPTAGFERVLPVSPISGTEGEAASEEVEQLGLEQIAHYKLVKKLGAGGMGLVFEALDTHLDRLVALKVMMPSLAKNPASRKRFLQEARSAAKIQHDHIVPIFQVGEDQGIPFLAMQLLEGVSLADLLKRQPVLKIRQVLRLGGQIAKGLAAAHARGLIHRDIKPGNVWIEPESGGRVKILDFGLARPEKGSAQLTHSGMIVGTPSYMAPEQARGEKNLDPRVDLFSLGCVLYLMSTGVMAFCGSDPVGVLMAVQMQEPPPPRQLNPEIPQELSDLIMKLLEKEPGKRPASAKDVVKALQGMERAQASVPTEASSELAAAISAPAQPPSVTAATPPDASNAFAHLALGATDAGAAAPALATTGAAGAKRKRGLLMGAAVAAGLLLVAAGIVFYLQTPHGTIRVEVLDDMIDVRLSQGKLHVKGNDAKEITIEPGERTLKISRDGFNFETPQFELRKGDKFTFKVAWMDGKVTVSKNGQPFDSQAPPVQVAQAGPGRLEPRLKNSLGMEFSLVPKGKAWLGGGGGKPGDKEVEFKEDFYLGVYEVTQEEWTLVTGSNPSQFNAVEGVAKEDQKRFPVEHVSWDDTQLFIQRLNATAKEAGWVYRLPTEAEWEYACRGGPMSHKLDSAFDFYFDKPAQELLPDQANWEHGKGLKRTCKVGSYKPNRLGLYDMHGNVWEWCEDIVSNGAHRMMRGGSWGDSLVFRCAARIRDPRDPSHRGNFLGLRVARVRVGTSDPDRRAAEYILSIPREFQALVMVNDVDRYIGKVQELPTEPFRLTKVHVEWASKFDDAGLANCQGCKHIKSLMLVGTQVTDKGLANLKESRDWKSLELHHNPGITDSALAQFRGSPNLTTLSIQGKFSDAGLIHFKDCKNLTYLDLGGTQVSDAGLASFKDCKNLTHLQLNDTPVSDAGLVHFADCKKLTYLQLNSTQVGDAGLAHFKDCKNVTKLVLHHTQVSDAGLAHFKDCKDFTYLDVHATQVGDAGLAHLKDCKNLTNLILAGTQVSDAGLAHLKDCKNLTNLNLVDTQVSDAGLERLPALAKLGSVNVIRTKATAAGVKKLSAALPLCKVEWDGGVIEPKRASADQLWEQQVAKLPPADQLKAVAEKLKERNPGFDGKFKHVGQQFGEVVIIHLSAEKITDLSPIRGLQKLQELVCSEYDKPSKLKDLSPLEGMAITRLNLSFTAVDDLSKLRGLPLTELRLSGAKVSDLSPLRGMKLNRLNLSDCPVTSLDALQGMPLEELILARTRANDLTPIKDCPLKALSVGYCNIVDLTLLRGMPLETLDISYTPVTDIGPLKGLKLKTLSFEATKVRDISPLRGMPLTFLWCSDHSTDHTPLRGMPLEVLRLPFILERDAEVLRSIPTLRGINAKPAKEFWSEVEKKR